MLLSALAAVEFTSAAMATLVAVITLVLTGQSVTPVNVFMLLSFNNVLQLSISYYVAVGLFEFAEAYTSLSRIEDFLLLDDLTSGLVEQSSKGFSDKVKVSRQEIDKDLNAKGEEWKDSNEDEFEKESIFPRPTPILKVLNLSCKLSNRDDYILQNIELFARPKSLTIITGPVGSGKSTLLLAIVGEGSDISGTVTCQGTLVFVPQIAWVFSGTIRENILFGRPYDTDRYNRILQACSLLEDIQQFPEYDQTVVGECGAVLSGGQRARVSLARAVYADADLYLLDDPLSAVDFKVSRHIFEKCINGLLSDKTRVLTSHQEEHMRKADEVIVLYKGHVLEKGIFSDLQQKGILNETIDPLLKKIPTTERKLEDSLEADRQDDQSPISVDREVAFNSAARGLTIPQEDRAIGVVSSKLYWDYFRSGVSLLVICAGICFCFITQGRPSSARQK